MKLVDVDNVSEAFGRKNLREEMGMSNSNVFEIIEMCRSSIEDKINRKFLEVKKCNDISSFSRKSEYIQMLRYEMKGIDFVKNVMEQYYKEELI